jgi:deoxyribodipyrimidine photolyase-related protein
MSKTKSNKPKSRQQTKRRKIDGKEGRILLTHQLFPREKIPESNKYVVVSDHMWLTDEKPFNKLTLLHRFISSEEYANVHGFHRSWIGNYPKGPFSRACRLLKKQGVKTVKIFDPIEIPLLRSIRKLCKRERLHLIVEETPAFLETYADLDNYLKLHPAKKRNTPDKKSKVNGYNHDTFYKWNRQKLDLLMEKDKKTPIGGKWTYDTENRKPFPKKLKEDPTELITGSKTGLSSTTTKMIPQIVNFIEKRYGENPGSLDNPVKRVARYPLTRKKALERINLFFSKMLPGFGPYEDAFRHENIPYGYHSVLSSSLNNGLITPDDIIRKIKELPLNTVKRNIASIEGFARQVIGWRSYTRLVYRKERNTMLRSNYLNHTRKLPSGWFTGDSPPTTGIDWLDILFKDATERAYSHHIIRLMVFSQWFLLNRFRPIDVMNWFWSVVSIDAYEWVMVPNVMGMGQFADGGIMMRRPYVSSAAYLKKMSGNTLPKNKVELKTTENWEDVWTSLYYSFLMDHEDHLGKIYAYSRSYAYAKKKDTETKTRWSTLSKEYRIRY